VAVWVLLVLGALLVLVWVLLVLGALLVLVWVLLVLGALLVAGWVLLDWVLLVFGAPAADELLVTALDAEPVASVAVDVAVPARSAADAPPAMSKAASMAAAHRMSGAKCRRSPAVARGGGRDEARAADACGALGQGDRAGAGEPREGEDKSSDPICDGRYKTLPRWFSVAAGRKRRTFE
jgi:hypothetical protein